MASYNRVILIGRLTRDPEMRHTTAGLAVTSFSIAVDRRTKNQQGEKVTDFFRCSAWRQQAEFVNEYARKGRLVAVDGRIEINEYTAQDGTRKQGIDVQVDSVQLLDRGDEGGGGGGAREGGGYDADADERPSRPAARPAASVSRDVDRDERPAARPAARPPARAEGAARPARAAAKPEPQYPADDFDDSDPFADE